ncbi:MAG: tetratricopeptide repeat protein, partial [Bacteroidetes bacterium]|nr:tetratricopeptide repeat protein [Bacteroidota bacterium]
MKLLSMRWVFSLTIILLYTQVLGQTSLRNRNADELFQQAHELYNKSKFAAAQDLFLQYSHVGQNSLMVSEARYYAAQCAGELMTNDAPLLAANFRDKHPENTSIGNSHYALGKYYFRSKNYRNCLFELIEIDPYILTTEEAKEYYFMAGYSQFHLGNIHEAKPYFREIVNFSGDYFHLTNYFYGYITFEENDYDEALKAFYRIENHESFSTIMPVYITEVYALMGDYDMAIEYGEKALGKKDIQKDHIIHLLLAQAYFKKGIMEKAYEHYGVYSKKRQLSAEDTYQYAYAAYKTANFKTAIAQFESFVVEDDSLGQNVNYLLAGSYLENGQKLDARNSFSLAMDQSFYPEIQEDAHLNYAKLSYELKFHKVAIKAFKGFIEKYPKSRNVEDAQLQFVRLLLGSNNYMEAFEVIENMDDPTEKLNGAYQRLGFNIGLEYFEIKDYQKARIYFNKSLARPVFDYFKALAHFWIGESLTQEERHKEAITAYKNFLAVAAHKETGYSGLAHYNLGYCNVKLEKFEDALFHYDSYLKSGNDIYEKQFNSDAYARMGDCYQALKFYDKSIASYDQVIKYNYTEMDYALYQKGMIEGLRENTEKKIAILLNLTEKYPNSPYYPDALYQLGNEHLIQGNKMQALREFEYLNQEFENSLYFKQAQIKMAIIHNQNGDFDKAVALFDTLISRFPKSSESRDALAAMKIMYVENDMAEIYFEKIAKIPNISVSALAKDSAMFNQAVIVSSTNDCGRSIASYDKYLKAFPSGTFTFEVLSYKADCHIALGENDKALTDLDKIIDNRPNPYVENALITATNLCFKNDSFTQAIPYLKIQEDVLKTSSELLEVYEGLARAYLEIDSCGNAEEYLKKISLYAEADSVILAKADYTLARCKMKNQDLREAIKLFQKVAEGNNSKLGAES